MRLITSVLIIIILCYNYRKGRLASSASVWAACYFLIFIVYPAHGMEGVANNAEIIDVYAVIGAFMFLIGMLFSERISIKPNKVLNKRYHYPLFYKALIAFFVFTALAVTVFIAQHGIGAVIGILLGTMTSKGIALGGDEAGQEELFIHLMLPCALAVWVSAESAREKKLRVVCFVIFCITHFLFSFTRIFLITFLAIILIYQLRNKKKKVQFFIMSLGVLALTLILISLNFIRCFGFGEDLSLNSLLDISYVFESTDFGASYTWFDELLSYGYPGISIITWFKPLYAFIPRSIWPTKPEPLSLQILKKVDPSLAADGYSTAGNSVLGEGYAILGVLGIIIFPLIWGIVCTYLDRKYYYRLKKGIDNNVENILYYLFAIFIILSAQRGDWSQYMTVFIYFWMIPLYLLSRKKRVSGIVQPV